MSENSDTNRKRTYSVSKWDPLHYRLFRKQIEAVKANPKFQSFVDKLETITEKWHSRQSQDPVSIDSFNPRKSVLPYVAAATFLAAIGIDYVTHDSDSNLNPDLKNNTTISQLADTNIELRPTHDIAQVIQEPQIPQTPQTPIPNHSSFVLLGPTNNKSEKTSDQEGTVNIPNLTFLNFNNPDFANLSSGFQSIILAYDRANIDKALSDFKEQNGIFGELVDGLLLYTPDAAHKELRNAGVDGRAAYTYKQMKPDIVAIVHSIPGLKKYIKDDFPAIIGIESDFRADLGPNSAGACGLSQVTNDGGYYEFYHPLISHSKEAREFRAENPRLVAGMDYLFKDMLKHDETRNLLAFYSEIVHTLDNDLKDLLKDAKKLRKERKHSDADQLDAEATEKKGLKRKAVALRNFVNMQFKFVHKNFSNRDYEKRKTKLSSEKFNLDKTMGELIGAFPELAESTGVEYSNSKELLKHLDILPRLKQTWKQARFHPVLNVYMGAFAYALDDFRVNNHSYVKKHVNDHEVRQGLVQRAYNAGWYRIKRKSLDKGKLPTIADRYVKKHDKRNKIFQEGHRTLYGQGQGIYAANITAFEGQLDRVATLNPNKRFHATTLNKLTTEHNTGQRNYK